jgi:spore coat protein U-like protein
MTRALARAGLAACILLLGAAGPASASTGTLAVSAVIVSKNNCKFVAGTAPVATVMNNGTAIDPSMTVTATGNAAATFSCNGSSALATFTVDGNDGAHALGPGLRRMRHATVATEFLPYTLAISPSSATVAKGTPVTVSMTASVLSTDYQNALAGTYSDTVTVTVSP